MFKFALLGLLLISGASAPILSEGGNISYTYINEHGEEASVSEDEISYITSDNPYGFITTPGTYVIKDNISFTSNGDSKITISSGTYNIIICDGVTFTDKFTGVKVNCAKDVTVNIFGGVKGSGSANFAICFNNCVVNQYGATMARAYTSSNCIYNLYKGKITNTLYVYGNACFSMYDGEVNITNFYGEDSNLVNINGGVFKLISPKIQNYGSTPKPAIEDARIQVNDGYFYIEGCQGYDSMGGNYIAGRGGNAIAFKSNKSYLKVYGGVTMLMGGATGNTASRDNFNGGRGFVGDNLHYYGGALFSKTGYCIREAGQNPVQTFDFTTTNYLDIIKCDVSEVTATYGLLVSKNLYEEYNIDLTSEFDKFKSAQAVWISKQAKVETLSSTGGEFVTDFTSYREGKEENKFKFLANPGYLLEEVSYNYKARRSYLLEGNVKEEVVDKKIVLLPTQEKIYSDPDYTVKYNEFSFSNFVSEIEKVNKTRLPVAENLQIKVEKLHKHSHMTLFEGTRGCTSVGLPDYYQCDECLNYYLDEDGMLPIGNLEGWKNYNKSRNGHVFQVVYEEKATCTKDGHLGYLHCKNCGKYFELDKTPISNLDEWLSSTGLLEKTGHNVLSLIQGKKATCSEAGYKDCYYCDRCEFYFEDESAKRVIGDEEAYQNWIAKDGKGYIATISHTWRNMSVTWDNDMCHGEATCSVCGEVVSETLKGVYVVDVEAKCLTNEKGHYEVTFTKAPFGKQESSQFEKANSALGHDYKITYTWNVAEKKCNATAVCSHCQDTIIEIVDATVSGNQLVAEFTNPLFVRQTKDYSPDTPVNPDDPSKKSGGCFGSVIASSLAISLLSLTGVSLLLIKKKKEQ